MQKMYNTLIEQLQAATTTVSFEIANAEMGCLQIQAGAITGTYTLKSRVGKNLDDDTFDYCTQTGLSISDPAGASANNIYEFRTAAPYYEFTYTHTSGTGSLYVGYSYFYQD